MQASLSIGRTAIVFPVDNEAKRSTPNLPKAGGPAARMHLRACEWSLLKREFPHGFDFDGSSHELKTALGLCVYLVASNRSWPMADVPHQAASARVAALVADIARHPDYQRLRAEMLFIVAARTAIGPLRFRRTECAVCARLKSGVLAAGKATGDEAG
jgi:hypothetical protein